MKILVDREDLEDMLTELTSNRDITEACERAINALTIILEEHPWKSEDERSEYPPEDVVHRYYFDDEIDPTKIDKNKHSILAILDFLEILDKKLVYHEGHEFGRGFNQSDLQLSISELKNNILGGK
jgi:hypothetical protein